MYHFLQATGKAAERNFDKLHTQWLEETTTKNAEKDAKFAKSIMGHVGRNAPGGEDEFTAWAQSIPIGRALSAFIKSEVGEENTVSKKDPAPVKKLSKWEKKQARNKLQVDFVSRETSEAVAGASTTHSTPPSPQPDEPLVEDGDKQRNKLQLRHALDLLAKKERAKISGNSITSDSPKESSYENLKSLSQARNTIASHPLVPWYKHMVDEHPNPVADPPSDDRAPSIPLASFALKMKERQLNNAEWWKPPGHVENDSNVVR